MEIRYKNKSSISEQSPEEQPQFDLDKLWCIIEEFICTNRKRSKTIYHYTTLDALVDGIIPKQKGLPLNLRATHCKYLNDPQEMTLNINKIHRDLKNIPDLQRLVGSSLKRTNKNQNSAFQLLSFSENSDYLPMWGMYAKNGDGISIGFDRNKIKYGNSIALKCLYPDSDEYKSLIKFLEIIFNDSENPIRRKFFEKFDKIQYPNSTIGERKERLQAQMKSEECDCFKAIINLISTLFIVLLPVLAYKDPAYEYEQEFRLISLPDESNSTQYKVKDGMIIPYLDVSIPLDAVKTIILGPTHDFVRSKRSLDMYLKSKGIDWIEIKKSTVPYRI